MLDIKLVQSDSSATKLDSPKGVKHSLIISAKPKETLSNKLMRTNGIWKARDKYGNYFESPDFIAAYLFSRDCGSGSDAQLIYERRRKENVI